MKNTIYSSIKQAICSKTFVLTVLAVVIMVFASAADAVVVIFKNGGAALEFGYHISIIKKALESDGVSFVLPILCTLPFAAMFVDEYRSGFIRIYISRINIKSYILSKVVACIVSGGLCLVFGLVISYVISAGLFQPREMAAKGQQLAPMVVEFAYSMILVFCSGGFWALVGMTIAAYTESKYMAYASPFVIYYVLIMLKERYFEKVYVIYAKQWINPPETWFLGKFGAFMIVAELTILFALLFYCVARKKIENV